MTEDRGQIVMKKILAKVWFFAVISCLLSPCSLNAVEFAGGTGEPNDPYQIVTAVQLIGLGEDPNLYDKHFVLMADIDLDPNLPGRRVFDQALIGEPAYRGRTRGPTEKRRPSFTGSFNGAGHIIKNLTISGEDNIGLFGATFGSVMGLGIVDAKVEGTSDVGILAGIGGGHVHSCFSTGCVKGKNDVGGLVGIVWGTIADCLSHASVNGTSSVGGLAGLNRGDIYCCYSTGQVNGEENVGGLIGSEESFGTATASSCLWDIKTSGQLESAGGLGVSATDLQDIQYLMYMGWDFRGERQNGLHESWQSQENGGYPELSIFHGFSPPILTGKGTKHEPFLISTAEELGAVQYYNLSASYRLMNDLDMDGIFWAKAVIPMFHGHFDGANHVIRKLKIFGGGSMGLFGYLSAAATVKDIGIVDAYVIGEGHSAGILVGESQAAQLTNCYSTGLVYGEDDVGGLVGINRSIIAHCYSRATVIAEGRVGGLAGSNLGGELTQCCTQGEVTGIANVGGLLGESYGNSEVNNCYSAGTVNGFVGVGGLVGVCDGGIRHSYSVSFVNGFRFLGGLIGVITNSHLDPLINSCFWDIESSGQLESDGGIGLATKKMQDINTYLAAGWDFINETSNGTEDIWWMEEGVDYPRLWWEVGAEN